MCVLVKHCCRHNAYTYKWDKEQGQEEKGENAWSLTWRGAALKSWIKQSRKAHILHQNESQAHMCGRRQATSSLQDQSKPEAGRKRRKISKVQIKCLNLLQCSVFNVLKHTDKLKKMYKLRVKKEKDWCPTWSPERSDYLGRPFYLPSKS